MTTRRSARSARLSSSRTGTDGSPAINRVPDLARITYCRAWGVVGSPHSCPYIAEQGKVIEVTAMSQGRTTLDELFMPTTCRGCGCWDYDACIDTEGGPCWWVDEDLCSGPAMP